MRPPSGVYALQEALRGGHDVVEVIGFDSIAGVFSTSSQITAKNHDEVDSTIQERMNTWVDYYKTVAQHYNEIEIIWQKQ